MFKNLKFGLFGYSRVSVCSYIAALNEDFSAKILEANEEHRQRVLHLEEKIKKLEEENQILSEQKLAVAQALIDARIYAQQLRDDAEHEHEMEVEKNQEKFASAEKRIDNVNEEISNLQRQLSLTIERMRSDLQSAKLRFNETQENLVDAAVVEEEKTATLISLQEETDKEISVS